MASKCTAPKCPKPQKENILGLPQWPATETVSPERVKKAKKDKKNGFTPRTKA
jgi:hypothetical protein